VARSIAVLPLDDLGGDALPLTISNVFMTLAW
jgi:uncharacterized protein (DUF486 family)